MIISALLFASAFLNSVFYIFIAFLILMFMVTIHELGHYISGKALGFKINEFAIGMGPKIYSRTAKSGEIFSIRALPLGGFCAFEGEENESPDSRAFNEQAPWKRLITLASGAVFNFVSAILIVIIAFSCFGDYLPVINTVYETSPNYAEQKLQVGDVIVSIEGQELLLAMDLSRYIAKAPDNMTVTVKRNGELITIQNVKKGEYIVDGTTYFGWGVGLLTNTERTQYSFGQAVMRSVPYCIRVGGYVLETLGGLLTGLIGLDQIGGPITTIDITRQVASSGIANILFLITLISVNLAVFNLLPVPALDGSKIIFVIIEWIRGKPINRKIEGYIHLVGIICLLLFAVFIDVIKWL